MRLFIVSTDLRKASPPDTAVGLRRRNKSDRDRLFGGPTYTHDEAACAHVGTKPFPYAGAFPEDAHWNRILPLVEQRGHHFVEVGGRADQEKDDKEERLKVEERGLQKCKAEVVSHGLYLGICTLCRLPLTMIAVFRVRRIYDLPGSRGWLRYAR